MRSRQNYERREFLLFPLTTWTDMKRQRDMLELRESLRKEITESEDPLLKAQLEASLELLASEIDPWRIL